mgnify:CR=1 FL=1
MKNELLTIGPFTVYGYGLMIAIGIVAGCLTAEYRAGKQKLDSEQIFPMILWSGRGIFLCKASLLDHRVEINCPGSGIYNGNFKLWFCGVWRYHRRDTDGAFVLQDQKACIF